MSKRKAGALPPPPLYVLRAHTADVTALCLCGLRAEAESTDASVSAAAAQRRMILASGSTDGILKLWDLVSRRVCVELNEHGGRGIIGLAWLAESTQLVSQGRDGCMRMWNVQAKFGGQDELQLELDVAFVMNHGSYTFTRISYAPASDGGLLLAPAANDNFFEIWDRSFRPGTS